MKLSMVFLLVAAPLALAVGFSGDHTNPAEPSPPDAEKAVLARLTQIQTAAQNLDPDKVFSFVMQNEHGALAQNGRLFLTREAALETTKQGFQGLRKVDYRF